MVVRKEQNYSKSDLKTKIKLKYNQNKSAEFNSILVWFLIRYGGLKKQIKNGSFQGISF